jgi:hypothetical protein
MVSQIGEIRNAYRIFLGTPVKEQQHGRLTREGRIILKQMFDKLVMMI